MLRLKLYRGTWCVVWHDGTTTRRKSLGTADRKVAERRFQDVRIERPNETVADAVALYLADKQTTSKSYASMLTSWRAVQDTFGHLRPDQITRELCRKYTAKRQRAHISNGTIRRDLGMLRAALKWTKRGGSAVFEFPESPPPRDRWLTKDEYEALLGACAPPHVRLFVVLGLATAGRASAILQLTWDRVDFAKNEINLARGQQTAKRRALVKMTIRAREALLAAQEGRETDHVIEWGGKPVRSIRKAFEGAVERAGLGSDVTPHTLRHTAAVWMVHAGVPMQKISQFLGHTTTKVTEGVYARYAPDFLADAVAALE